MSFSHAAAIPKLKTALLLGLAAIAFTMLAVAATPATAGQASGGGISPSGESEQSEPGAKKKSKYRRIWNRTSKRQKRWAHRTAECESGRNPKAIGGGGKYRGAFQFLKSTWRSSPKSPGGDPIAYNYKTQAVVAVALKRRAGTSPWPTCG